MYCTPNPKHDEITPIKIGGERRYDWRYPRPGDFSPAFDQTINGPALARLMLTESWHPYAEIIPNYVPKFAKEGFCPEVQVRVKIFSEALHTEPESYSYLRYSKGPDQGFFWDIYGDDMQTFELAVLALYKAPAPFYCGPKEGTE